MDLQINEIIQNVLFGFWLLLLSTWFWGFIPCVDYINNSFFYYLVVLHYVSISVYDGDLGCMQFGTIKNTIVLDIFVQVFLWVLFSFFLGKYIEVEFLGRGVGICLTLWETARCFQSNFTIVQLPAMYCSIASILATVSPSNFQPKMSLSFNLRFDTIKSGVDFKRSEK